MRKIRTTDHSEILEANCTTKITTQNLFRNLQYFSPIHISVLCLILHKIRPSIKPTQIIAQLGNAKEAHVGDTVSQAANTHEKF